MPDLTDKEKRKIFEEVRAKERADRKRKRPSYVTISGAEARRSGYHPVTRPYSTRQFDQCAMLDNVVSDFASCDIKLVRVGVQKNKIEVWRKVWDRVTPNKKVQRVGQPPQELCEFLTGLLSSLSSLPTR